MTTTRIYGIRLKLYGALLVVSLLFVIFAAVVLELQVQTAKRAAVFEAEHVASSIAITGIENPLNDPPFLQRYVTQLHKFHLRDLFIVDANKRTLASADPRENGRIFSGDTNNEVGKTMRDGHTRTFSDMSMSAPHRAQEVVVPFRNYVVDPNGRVVDNRVIGAVVFEYTQIYDDLLAMAMPMIYLTATIGFAVILVMVALGIGVASRISQPLEDLKRGVAKLAVGDFDAKVMVRTDDEIGALATAFNKMSADLRVGQDKLLEYQSTLEDRLAQLSQSNILLNDEVLERKRAEEQLAYLARFDSLTGLPNRHMLHDHLTQALALAKRTGALLGCMFVDLDRFKAINDTYGHGIGDMLLSQMGARLKRCVRGTDMVGRLGGDEFAIVLSNLAKVDDAGRVAQKIVDALSVPFDLGGRETYSSASIGISVYPQDGDEVEVLLAKADMGMYRAKQQGRNSYHFYLPLMNDEAAQRLQLETGLRGALERNEFLLHYQPKVDLRTGTVSGFEALLRWQRPQHGLVSPAQFIPILEDTGLIEAVGDWVLRTACLQIKDWAAQGLPPCPIAVNLSARQFQQADFDVRAGEIINAHGINPALIEFEITESMLMRNPEEAAGVARKLKQLGVKLSVDDFGTGYSSLAYLQRFPLDTLKIDRVFVRDVIADPNNAVIILAIINLAHNLRLKVVAEGVETEAQLRFLRMHGCDEMQGYYFARPQGVDECTRALAEDRRLQLPAEANSADAAWVLVVDDNEADLEIIGRALKFDGYHVLVENDPRSALQTLMQHSFGIVISDHSMPHMSGVTFMTHVRNLSPRSVRIVISGSGDTGSVVDAVNTAGIHRYISKDWAVERLRTEVRDAFLRDRPNAA